MERRGGSLNKEVEWKPLFGGTQGGKFRLDKEVEWRPLFGGKWGGAKFKERSRMETIVWWNAGEEV